MPLPDWFLESARALIRADSVSAVGNAAALAVLDPLYSRAGLTTQRFEWRESIDGAPAALHANLLAGPGGGFSGAAPGGVLLVTHTDTVPTGPLERWTETFGDPRALTQKDGWLFGLGTADVKLDALCKIAAAERLRGKKLQRPFWLCGTAAEEVGLRGARRFAESEFFRDMQVREVICGEPSELQLIRAHKGYAVVVCTVVDPYAPMIGTPANPNAGDSLERLEFSGKAAHSSTPHLGENAIHKALVWIEKSPARLISIRGGASSNTVPALCTLELAAPAEGAGPLPHETKRVGTTAPRLDIRRALTAAAGLEKIWLSLVHALEPTRDPTFDPAGAVGGLNVIASDSNDTQADVRVTLDARLLPTHDPDQLLARFQVQAAAHVQAAGAGKLSLRIQVSRNAGGMSLADDSPLVAKISRTLTRLGLDGAPRAKPTSTEAGVFARAGCEAVVIGPGRSTGNAHTANERIEIAQLARAIDLYEALIEDLCAPRS